MGWETLAGGALGMITAPYNDNRQYNQQERLQRLQMQGSKEMTDYNMQKQMEMWKATNFPAQLAMLKQAGLSPGLMYGKGGPGGTTTGTPSGSVTGAIAPSGGGEIQSMMQLGMQKELQQAQIENIKANTAKTNTEAEKIGGVDTGLVRTNIMKGFAEIDNIRAGTALKNVETRIATIEANIKGRTEEDVVRAIGWAAEKVMQEMEGLRYETNIKEDTWQTKVKQAEAELISIYLRNTQTRAQTAQTIEETNAIAVKLQQSWDQLGINQQNANTAEAQQKLNKWKNDVRDSWKLTVETAEGLIESILRKTPRSKGTKTYKEGEKDGKPYSEYTETIPFK